MENEAKKELTLEEAFLRLDEIINRLENKDTTLEASFAGYQEGMELFKALQPADRYRRKEDSCLKRRGRNA